MSPKITQRQECQIFSRVCGWYVPKGKMNKGKLAERADFKYYDLKKYGQV